MSNISYGGLIRALGTSRWSRNPPAVSSGTQLSYALFPIIERRLVTWQVYPVSGKR
jgi:hypothetical protein